MSGSLLSCNCIVTFFRVKGEQCFPFCTGVRLAKVADSQSVMQHFVHFD